MQPWVPTTSNCRRSLHTANLCRLEAVSKLGRHGTIIWWMEWLNTPIWTDQQSFGTCGRTMSNKPSLRGSCTPKSVPSTWRWLGAACRQTLRQHWMRCQFNVSDQHAPFLCSFKLMHGVVTSPCSLQQSMEQVWLIGLADGGDIEQLVRTLEKFDGSP